MQEQINQLNNQIKQLQNQVNSIQNGDNLVFIGNLDDVLIERVLNTSISGTPSTNTLLRTITIGAGSATVLDYPERMMIYTWKGQRLAIPVYDANKIIYP